MVSLVITYSVWNDQLKLGQIFIKLFVNVLLNYNRSERRKKRRARERERETYCLRTSGMACRQTTPFHLIVISVDLFHSNALGNVYLSCYSDWCICWSPPKGIIVWQQRQRKREREKECVIKSFGISLQIRDWMRMRLLVLSECKRPSHIWWWHLTNLLHAHVRHHHLPSLSFSMDAEKGWNMSD